MPSTRAVSTPTVSRAPAKKAARLSDKGDGASPSSAAARRPRRAAAKAKDALLETMAGEKSPSPGPADSSVNKGNSTTMSSAAGDNAADDNAMDATTASAAGNTTRRSVGGTRRLRTGHASLLEAALDPDAAMGTAATEWARRYARSPMPALLDAVNLIVAAAGCKRAVVRGELVLADAGDGDDEEDDVDVDAAAAAVLRDLEKAEFRDVIADSLGAAAAPAASRRAKREREAREASLRTQLSEFWTRSVRAVGDALYDDVLLETLVGWVTVLSASKVRSFRRVATSAGLDLVEALIAVAAECSSTLEVQEHQLDAASRKGRASKQLKDMIANLHGNVVRLENHMTSLFQGVFQHRYRDRDPEIRAQCIDSLGRWTCEHPAMFLEDNYLKYIGWTLSDRESAPRLACVRALVDLYMEERFFPRLRQFTDRFKARMLEMVGDVSDTVAAQSVTLCGLLAARGALTRAQLAPALLRICDASAEVREAAAELVSIRIRVATANTSSSSSSSSSSAAAAAAVAADNAGGRGGRRSSARQSAQDTAAVAAQMSEIGKARPASGSSQRPSAADCALQLDAAIEVALEILSPGADTVAVTDPARHIVGECSASVPALADVASLVSALARGDYGGDEAPVAASFLLHAVARCISETARLTAGGRRNHAAQVAEARERDARNALVRGLPGLIRSYAAQPSVLARLVDVAGLVDPSWYSAGRLSAPFEDLVSALEAAFTQRSEPEVLNAVAGSLASLAYGPRGTHALQGRASQICDGLVEGVVTSLSKAAAGVPLTEDEHVDAAVALRRLDAVAARLAPSLRKSHADDAVVALLSAHADVDVADEGSLVILLSIASKLLFALRAAVDDKDPAREAIARTSYAKVEIMRHAVALLNPPDGWTSAPRVRAERRRASRGGGGAASKAHASDEELDVALWYDGAVARKAFDVVSDLIILFSRNMAGTKIASLVAEPADDVYEYFARAFEGRMNYAELIDPEATTAFRLDTVAGFARAVVHGAVPRAYAVALLAQLGRREKAVSSTILDAYKAIRSQMPATGWEIEHEALTTAFEDHLERTVTGAPSSLAYARELARQIAALYTAHFSPPPGALPRLVEAAIRYGLTTDADGTPVRLAFLDVIAPITARVTQPAIAGALARLATEASRPLGPSRREPIWEPFFEMGTALSARAGFSPLRSRQRSSGAAAASEQRTAEESRMLHGDDMLEGIVDDDDNDDGGDGGDDDKNDGNGEVEKDDDGANGAGSNEIAPAAVEKDTAAAEAMEEDQSPPKRPRRSTRSNN